MDYPSLKEIGLTENEAKVYIALLRLGESTSGPVIEESGVSASKVYNLIDRLAKKGLVGYAIKQKTKYFFATPPTRLLEYVQEKERDLQKQKEALKETISQLNYMAGSAIKKETVQLFQGLKGIQAVRERSLELMKKGEEMWLVGIARTPYEGSMVEYFKDFHKRRYQKGIKCKYIYNDYAKDFAAISATYPHSEVRVMPEGLITHGWWEIYANTVGIGINLRKSFSLVIEDKDIADSFRVYANLIWQASKPFKK